MVINCNIDAFKKAFSSAERRLKTARVAILCPGPSLSTWPVQTFDAYDFRIGVNRAVLYAACDAWAAFDWKPIIQHAPTVPLPLYTDAVADEHLRPRWERYREFKINVVERRTTYTATNALHIARDMGATSIDVYGADWTDQPDFDGVKVVGCVRDAARWDRERGAWNAVVEEIGIKVQRREK